MTQEGISWQELSAGKGLENTNGDVSLFDRNQSGLMVNFHFDSVSLEGSFPSLVIIYCHLELVGFEA